MGSYTFLSFMKNEDMDRQEGAEQGLLTAQSSSGSGGGSATGVLLLSTLVAVCGSLEFGSAVSDPL